jgi:hypothetical protein
MGLHFPGFSGCCWQLNRTENRLFSVCYQISSAIGTQTMAMPLAWGHKNTSAAPSSVSRSWTSRGCCCRCTWPSPRSCPCTWRQCSSTCCARNTPAGQASRGQARAAARSAGGTHSSSAQLVTFSPEPRHAAGFASAFLHSRNALFIAAHSLPIRCDAASSDGVVEMAAMRERRGARCWRRCLPMNYTLQRTICV